MPIWSQFVDLIEWGLRSIADFTGSAGVAIILFTILIKTLLLPLTIRSVRSTAAIQELQPKIKDLQKRYGNDRPRLSAEQMKLYQEYGINPTAGCLPMLLQIPIFFGLYFAIRDLSTAGVGVWGQGFLWIPDLSHADPIKVLPILAGVFQFVQTRMTRPAGQKTTDPQQQMMNSMMMFMPLMVVVFGWNFAAGPVLYWVVQAVYSVIQQWLITGWGGMHDWLPFLPELPEHRRLGYESPERRAAKKAKQQGGLFAKLNEQVAKQAAQVEEDRKKREAGELPATAASGKKSTRGRPAPVPDEPAVPGPAPATARPDLVPRRPRSGKNNRSAEGE